MREHGSFQTIDSQTIRMQEIMSDNQRESGFVEWPLIMLAELHGYFLRRIPRTVECELIGDLVDSCLPGDVVTIAGEVKVLSVDDFGNGKKDQSLFLLYILVN